MSRTDPNRVLVAIHRYVGLVTLLFLLFAAVTGCILIFFDQLDVAVNPDLYRAQDSGPTQTAPALAAMVESAHPEIRIVSLPLTVSATQNLLIRVTGRDGRSLAFDEIFVDPRTGAVVGRRDDEAMVFDRHHLMPLVYLFHFELLAGGPGRWLMGMVALFWLLEMLVGFYLTLPQRSPFWERWKVCWQLRGKGLPRLMLDLHRATGLWLFAGLIVLSLTSFGLNFYYEAVQPAVLAVSPRNPSPLDRPPHSPTLAPPPVLGFTKAVELGKREATRYHPDLKPAFATYDPGHGLYGVDFTSTGTQVYRGSGPVAYYFNDQNGRLVFADDPSRDSAGQVLLRSIYPLHSGQVAGWISELVVFILGLSMIEMGITGVIVWWKKRPARVARRAASASSRRRHAPASESQL